ncbi:alpha/beta hydrolase [Vibrio sp.]|uniref:Alpha/beta hydrolase n=1 Tax=Vibrio viridaestus TaxID=2487322 RepID=A0A3N9TE23_9VIBR|nr:alpha/beta hydrolase [Vibrio viridaestus]MDC0609475.1 alpha/beta hydrolase [Vibrio sp.]RQW61953.1 alpha/beta hydrolase [Vibrio viridaestus]
MKSSLLHHKTYICAPNADWLVFIHGAGGSSATWFKQVRYFRQYYNIVLVDLRGHGESTSRDPNNNSQRYSFSLVTQDVIDLLDFLNIKSAHFVGMSMGTIIVRTLIEIRPALVKTMILAGATVKLNCYAQGLITIGNLFKDILPYMWLYRFFAFVVMPQRCQKEARNIFINEARKLNKEEFKRWFALTKDAQTILKRHRKLAPQAPTIYIMGDKDRFFLEAVVQNVSRHETSHLKVMVNCGHVCNIEQPDRFNQIAEEFLSQYR